jgi:protein involved in polysaccharide export with SLBB domain
MCRVSKAFLAFACGMSTVFGQIQQQPLGLQPNVPQAIRPDYRLGPNDQILIRSSAEELNERPFRVEADGFLTLPLVNRVQAGGRTVQELETDLITRLRQFFVQPQVNITITATRSETVSFFGAFVRPGVYPLTGGGTLLEMLAVTGGFSPNAIRRIRVTRRAEYGVIPLPSAIVDPVAGTSTVEISLDTLLRELNPAEDIVLQAFDRVTVDQSLPVYVTGEATRAAPVELTGRQSITVMQALSQVGGFTPNAKRTKIQVLRPIEGTARLAHIDIDVQRILDGQDNDFPLYSNDILYIPRSAWATLGPQVATGIITSLPYLVISALITRANRTN